MTASRNNHPNQSENINPKDCPEPTHKIMSPFSDDVKDHSPVDIRELSEIEQFKIPLGRKKEKGMAMAMDWSCYLTEESAARRPSALKAAFEHLNIPGIISLGGGLPLPAYFPFHEVNVRVPRIGKWSEAETASEGTAISIVKYAHSNTFCNEVCANGYVNGHSDEQERVSIVVREATMPTVGLSTTLQYGIGTGEANLLSFLKQHIQMVHNPPYEDWSITLTCGNTYSYYTCLRMLVERGDYIIMEEYAYSSAISACAPMGIKIVGIEMDAQGMTASGLDYVLSTWDISSRGGRKPRVIYLVPYVYLKKPADDSTGQNPTGASMLLQRRKDIYRVCQKHNLIILEDEPYYFLQMDPYDGKPTPVPDLSNTELLHSLVPSFMAMDVDGRVIRLDSFSKVRLSS